MIDKEQIIQKNH